MYVYSIEVYVGTDVRRQSGGPWLVWALCTLILSKWPPWRYEEDAATRCTLPGVACASSMAMVESKASGPGSCSRSGLLR